MKKVSVEHIEKDFVLCENIKNGERIYLDINSVPKNVKEGNILNLYNGKIEIDHSNLVKIKLYELSKYNFYKLFITSCLLNSKQNEDLHYNSEIYAKIANILIKMEKLI